VLEVDKPCKPWDVSCNMGKPGLYKLMYALIMVGGHFTNSFHLDFSQRYTPQIHARFKVDFRIWIPEGREEKFEKLSGLKITPPPRVQVGMGGLDA